MNSLPTTSLFASTYNSDVYGGQAYSSQAKDNTSTAQSSQPNTESLLADTGLNVIAPLGGGALLIAIGATLLLRRFKRSRS